MNCIKQVLCLNEIKKEVIHMQSANGFCASERSGFRISLSVDTLNFIKSECIKIQCYDATFADKDIQMIGIKIVIDNNLKFGDFEILRKM